MKNLNLKEKPLVSIIIPAFRAGKTIQKCLNSICYQSYHKYEVILIYDEPTEEMKEILTDYFNFHFPNKGILIFNEKRIGQQNALNQGIKKSKGKFICLLDADDYWISNKLMIQVYEMVKRNLDFSYMGILVCDKEGYIYEAKEKVFWMKNVFNYWLRKRFICPSSIMFKESLIRETGFYNSKLNYCEDLEFMFRVLVCTDKIGFIDSYSVVHLRDVSTKTFHKESELTRQMIFKMWNKTEPYSPRFINLWLFIIRFTEKYLIRDSKFYTKEKIRL